jgi:hypothetical protein
MRTSCWTRSIPGPWDSRVFHRYRNRGGGRGTAQTRNEPGAASHFKELSKRWSQAGSRITGEAAHGRRTIFAGIVARACATSPSLLPCDAVSTIDIQAMAGAMATLLLNRKCRHAALEALVIVVMCSKPLAPAPTCTKSDCHEPHDYPDLPPTAASSIEKSSSSRHIKLDDASESVENRSLGESGGGDRIRTDASRFCRPLPYHLGTPPEAENRVRQTYHGTSGPGN